MFLFIRPRTSGRRTGRRRLVALLPVRDVYIELYTGLDMSNCHVLASSGLCQIRRFRRRRGAKRRQRHHNDSDQRCEPCSALQHLEWVPLVDAVNWHPTQSLSEICKRHCAAHMIVSFLEPRAERLRKVSAPRSVASLGEPRLRTQISGSQDHCESAGWKICSLGDLATPKALVLNTVSGTNRTKGLFIGSVHASALCNCAQRACNNRVSIGPVKAE